MSLPDHLLEPDEICEIHGELMPCYICRIEWVEEIADAKIQEGRLTIVARTR